MKVRKYVGLVIGLSALFFFSFQAFVPQKVFAYEPGCYESTAGTGIGSPRECPSGFDFDPTLCYTIVDGKRGNPDSYSTFDCDGGEYTDEDGGTEEIDYYKRACETGGNGTWVVDSSSPNGGSCTCAEGYQVTPIRGDDGVTRDNCVITQEEIDRQRGGGVLDENNPIIKKVLKPIVRALSAFVGLAVIISLVIAGIQYAAARDNAQMVAAAKSRMLMAVLALVIFIFGFAVLQWLVPGGVLSI